MAKLSVMTSNLVLPANLGLFYGGQWHEPMSGRSTPIHSAATGEEMTRIAVADAQDVDAAVAAARKGFAEWRHVRPLERARILKALSSAIRENAGQIAYLDAADGGNPIVNVESDIAMAAGLLDYFAGLVTEMKGETIPMGPDAVNYTVREPKGVVARIAAFNHPFLFAASRLAAPLAAGNAVILKPAEQAPLSGIRLAELCEGLFPAGVVNILNGDKEAGAALATHPGVDMVTLVGSIPTGRAIMRAASDTLKHVLFELGGKNALIAYPDVDVEKVADGIVAGMNYTWCGQSCGSTSRVFLHDDIYDQVIPLLASRAARFKPGFPLNRNTTMGSIVSKAQHERILSYIESAKSEGARLLCGGSWPGDPDLADGFYIEPTIFADVTPDMRIAREEIFGPVQAISRWSDESAMFAQVNALEYGLTAAIFTKNLNLAHRAAARVESGYVWINTVGHHFLGAPFGGYKQSGIGREECLSELYSFSQEKNVHIALE